MILQSAAFLWLFDQSVRQDGIWLFTKMDMKMYRDADCDK